MLEIIPSIKNVLDELFKSSLFFEDYVCYLKNTQLSKIGLLNSLLKTFLIHYLSSLAQRFENFI
jgi:TFIIF-interacting CTD phosphatase-like protein